MAGLQDQIFESSAWVSSVVRLINTVGAPVVSVVPNYDGEALADRYVMTFSDVDTIGNTAKCYVGVDAPNNPYKVPIAGGRSSIDIVLDGVTVHTNVIPGYDVVFSASGSFLNLWGAEVRAGDFAGTFNAYGTGAGTPGAGRQHRVLNTDAGAAADCKVTLKTEVVHVKRTGSIFALVKPYADAAVERTADDDPVDPAPGSQQVRPYRITVANVTGSGAGKTMDVLVDGAPVTVRNLSSGVSAGSTGLNVVDHYKIESGNLQSVEFQLSQAATGSNTANLLVFPTRFTQIAPDVSGVAGTYGTSDIILTQVGESAGIIQPTEVAYYWVRAVVPEAADSESNPYPTNVFLTGKQTGTAGWTA